MLGGGDTQNDYTFPISCPCATNAGNVTAQNVNLCGTSATVTVPFTGGQILDADDLLRYILFSDLADPEGSIILQSTSPTFSFNSSTMNLGETYYLGTIAGNNLNGLVDIDDPCLDFSNAFAQAIWREIPAVSFSASPEVCANGCHNVAVSFTGSSPFNLTYTTSTGGTQSGFFSANAGVLQVCPPPGFSGSFEVNAVSVSDVNCVCN